MSNILVCEDEGIVAREIQSTLERYGYNVVGRAGSGEEAIRLASENTPDLALMDINLPGSLDGIATAQFLKEHYNVPVVYLTAYGDDETFSEAKQTQPLGYLLKPFREDELHTTIEAALHNFYLQNKEINKLVQEVNVASKETSLNSALEYQKDFLTTTKTNAIARVLNNLSRYIYDDLSVVTTQLSKLSDADSMSRLEIADTAKVATIHHEYILWLMERLMRIGEDSKVETERLLIDDVIINAISDFKRKIDDETLFLENFYPNPLYAEVDGALIKEALLHLFRNAHDAKDSVNVINISTTMFFEGSPERFNPKALPGSYVEVRISDFGEGINEERLDKIFEPFLSYEDNLSGMGLIVVHDIVQKQGGWVKVISDGHLGSQVSLFMPISK